MFHLLSIGILWLLFGAVNNNEEKAYHHIVFVIISQSNKHHEERAELLRQNIFQQAKHLNYHQTHVYLTHKDFSKVIGAWTFFPLFERLAALYKDSWIFFCDDVTQIDVKKLVVAVSDFDAKKDYFLGYALRDNQPTIIHHYASTDPDSVILYPDISAGFLISPSLLHKSALRWRGKKEMEFSIDPKYELARLLWNDGRVTKLLNVSFLCLHKSNDNCATWIGEIAPDCGQPVPVGNLYFAVKTCQRFHQNRVAVVRNTWAKDCSSVFYFSDVEDTSVPTIDIGVENVQSGHCEKTLSILRYILGHKVSAEWIIIADDDTLLSVRRLQKLLSCYDASDDIALGERYAYGVAVEQGYDYITGGGGMVFSLPVVRKLTSFCTCPSIDSPDDMIIGLCLKRLGIPVLHSPYFHQARPEDYATDYLSHQKPVSFHKHWMVDPYAIYEDWLQENDSLVSSDQHHEL